PQCGLEAAPAELLAVALVLFRDALTQREQLICPRIWSGRSGPRGPFLGPVGPVTPYRTGHIRAGLLVRPVRYGDRISRPPLGPLLGPVRQPVAVPDPGPVTRPPPALLVRCAAGFLVRLGWSGLRLVRHDERTNHLRPVARHQTGTDRVD